MSRVARFDRSLLEIARRSHRPLNPKRTLAAAKKATRTEHVEQRSLIERLAAIGRPELELLYAIPNGSYKSKAAAGKFKAEGLKPNVPDLCLPVPRWPFHGLYIEMKQIGKYAGPGQREFQARLIGQGYAVVECQGDEAAERIVVNYLKLSPWRDGWGSMDGAAEGQAWLRAAAAGGQGRAIVRFDGG